MISTYSEMNLRLKAILSDSPDEICKYASKRIEELEELADYVEFINDGWYGCPGNPPLDPCQLQATGAYIKEFPYENCHNCGRIPLKDFKFLRLDLRNNGEKKANIEVRLKRRGSVL